MSEQQDTPEFDPGDEALLAWAARSPDEWRAVWLQRARETGEGVVDPAVLEKETAALRKAGKYDEAMTASIAHQMAPAVTIPPQPNYRDLSPRLQTEYLRRGLAAQRPKP